MRILSAVVLIGLGWGGAGELRAGAREDIFLLTLEHIRTAPQDYQRTVKAAETRLKSHHADAKTPAATVEKDLQSLNAQAQKMRLMRSRGQFVPQSADAAALVQKLWSLYQLDFDAIVAEVERRKAAQEQESQIYWNVTQAFYALKEKTAAGLLWNAPDRQKSLDKLLAEDEVALLKMLEPAEIKTRGRPDCVVGMHDEPRAHNFDTGPFYRSLGALPGQSPTAKGAFAVPPGCRTVMQREPGNKLIFRVSQGRGAAFVGDSETDLQYGYLQVPPDTRYYFENTEREPLYLEFIGLPR
jgi:mannose-6-phosphate isomerase-like protein (cupin superfamily)